MKKIEELANFFIKNPEEGEVIESFQDLIYEKDNISNLKIPDAKFLESQFSNYLDRDHVIVDIKQSDSDPITIDSKNIDRIDEFLQNIRDKIEIEDEEDIYNLKITVNKDINEKALSIFCLLDFFQDLQTKSLNIQLSRFEKLLSTNTFINFQVYEEIEPFNTYSFYFTSAEANQSQQKNKAIPLKPENNRSKVIETRNEVCHFINAADYTLVPDDFHLNTTSKYEEINKYFGKLLTLISTTFVFDLTSIKNSLFNYKLKGYKTISGEIDFTDLTYSHPESIFKIYCWVYAKGNVDDKLGLTRNILSLYLSTDNPFNYSAQIYSSIQSGFSIYLKDNVKEYIQLKNKVSDYLFEFSNKAKEISNSFISAFKRSVLMILTFLLTGVLANIIKGGTISEILSNDLLVIGLSILLIVFLYLALSNYELWQAVKMQKKLYSKLKKRYSEILDENDLSNIFDGDYIINTEVSSLKKTAFFYNFLWILSLVVILAGVYLLKTESIDIEGWILESKIKSENISEPEKHQILERDSIINHEMMEQSSDSTFTIPIEQK